MKIIIALLSIIALASCGSSGSSDTTTTTAPPPVVDPGYSDKSATIQTKNGVFATETNTTLRVFSGARAGEVEFRSYALNQVITGKDGDEVRSTDGTMIFYIVYTPTTGVLRLFRIGNGHEATWHFAPSSAG